MFNKNNDNKLNVKKVNEGLDILLSILKICFFLIIILSIYIFSKILIDWNVLNFIKNILHILTPFFIGILVAWLLEPFVKFLNKKGINRVISTMFVYTVMISFIIVLCVTVFPSIVKQINEIAQGVPRFINFFKDNVDNVFTNLSFTTHYDFNDIKNGLYDSINSLGNSLTVNLPSKIISVIKALLDGGVNLIFGLIIGFYMLFDFNNVRKHLLSLIPKNMHNDTIELTNRLNKNLRNYIQGTLSIMFILFCFQSFGLYLAGLPSPLVFGLFSAVTNVIPYLGPYIGGLPIVLVGLSVSPTVGVFSLISVFVCQFLESYLLQPVVMGNTMKLHPVTIMIGLLIFGNFFGIIGMIFATPIISVSKTIFSYFNEKYGILKRFNKSDN